MEDLELHYHNGSRKHLFLNKNQTNMLNQPGEVVEQKASVFFKPLTECSWTGLKRTLERCDWL